jgi:hypothetical protein
VRVGRTPHESNQALVFKFSNKGNFFTFFHSRVFYS